jgi:hypothetical protein
MLPVTNVGNRFIDLFDPGMCFDTTFSAFGSRRAVVES